MALQDITTVQISLETAAVTRASFGTPIFIGEHNYFAERSRSYTKLTDVAVDFPATSNEYIAATGFFSADKSPNLILIGRQETDLITVTPAAATAIGQVYTIDVTGTDLVTTQASFTTTTGSETPTAIATALATAIGSPVGVTVTDATGSVTLAKSGTAAFSISTVRLSVVTYTTTETAPEALAAISGVNDDFYFVTAHDHSETFVLAMAADVEARDKIYFTSNRVSGVAIAQNPTTGNILSSTELNNLNDRNANFVVKIAGNNIYRTGKVIGNEWIDAIRNRDFLVARITEGLQNKQIASPVIPYTDSGINQIRSVVTSVLNLAVSTANRPNILTDDNPYTTFFPRAIDVPTVDKQNRVLNASFSATLAGAIQITNVDGSLTLEAQG